MENNPSISPFINAGIAIEKRSSAADSIAAKGSDDIRVLSPSEYKEAARCLAEAFRDDEVVRYPIDTPDRADWTEEQLFELHKETIEFITYAHCLKGLVTTTGDNYGCVALWMPPGKNMDDILTIVRSGMWRLKYKLSAEGKKRFFDEFLPLLHHAKEEVMGDRDKESWYLVYIGTKAESRGKGYAKKLIKHITQRCDQQGRACYLESSNDINPIIYGKLGFKVIKEIKLTRGPKDIRMDCMVREPEPLHREKEMA